MSRPGEERDPFGTARRTDPFSIAAERGAPLDPVVHAHRAWPLAERAEAMAAAEATQRRVEYPNLDSATHDLRRLVGRMPKGVPITPEQAIALDEWQARWPRIIAIRDEWGRVAALRVGPEVPEVG